jgi:hypothetical protein
VAVVVAGGVIVATAVNTLEASDGFLYVLCLVESFAAAMLAIRTLRATRGA